MAEMKQEPLETQIRCLIVAEDMELVNHQVGIKNEIKDEEDQEVEVKEEIEPHQRIKTLAEIKVEIPPDSTPFSCSNYGQICCSDCMRTFSKESQLQRHKCFARQKNVCSNVQSKKTPTPIIQSVETLLSENPPPSVSGQNPFRCPVCMKSFQWESHLYVHMRVHTGERKNICKLCMMTFKNKSEYQKHLLKHKEMESPKSKVSKKNDMPKEKKSPKKIKKNGSLKPFVCSLCNFYFVQEKSLIEHQKRIHYLCPVCSKQCSNLSRVSNHERIHFRADGTIDPNGSSKLFSCSICEKTFAVKKDLIKHLEELHKIGPFICSECGMHFICQKALTRHLGYHLGWRHHKCSKCEASFTAKRKLELHMRTHEEPFACSFCTRTFQQKHSLTKHMESHVDLERPFKCSLCEKSCVSQRELLQHQRFSHHICPICSERSSGKESMRKHLLSHPWAEVEAYRKPYKCSECGLLFQAENWLLRHKMTMHSEETPFECAVCGKRFKTETRLRSHHKAKHTDPRPSECSLCKKRFKSQGGLNLHMYKQHRNRKPLPAHLRTVSAVNKSGMKLLKVKGLAQSSGIGE